MNDEKKPLPPPSAEKRGLSTGVKVLLGCGAVTLLAIVVTCGGFGLLGWWGWSKMDAFGQQYVAKGYKRQTGQVLEVPGPVTEPTVYTGQVVRITGEVNADIAIMAQVAEITGQVNGDIDFTGQVLHIKPGGMVKGDIRVDAAQSVMVDGTVEGQVTGNYGVLQNRKLQSVGETTSPPAVEQAPEASKTAPADETSAPY